MNIKDIERLMYRVSMRNIDIFVNDLANFSTEYSQGGHLTNCTEDTDDGCSCEFSVHFPDPKNLIKDEEISLPIVDKFNNGGQYTYYRTGKTIEELEDNELVAVLTESMKSLLEDELNQIEWRKNQDARE